MKYPNIKAAHLSHADIAKAFGYKTVKSFNCSSAHKRHMEGVETILDMMKPKTEDIPKVRFIYNSNGFFNGSPTDAEMKQVRR